MKKVRLGSDIFFEKKKKERKRKRILTGVGAAVGQRKLSTTLSVLNNAGQLAPGSSTYFFIFHFFFKKM